MSWFVVSCFVALVVTLGVVWSWGIATKEELEATQERIEFYKQLTDDQSRILEDRNKKLYLTQLSRTYILYLAQKSEESMLQADAELLSKYDSRDGNFTYDDASEVLDSYFNDTSEAKYAYESGYSALSKSIESYILDELCKKKDI